MKYLTTLAAAVAILSIAEARKTYLVKTERNLALVPHVKDFNC